LIEAMKMKMQMMKHFLPILGEFSKIHDFLPRMIFQNQFWMCERAASELQEKHSQVGDGQQNLELFNVKEGICSLSNESFDVKLWDERLKRINFHDFGYSPNYDMVGMTVTTVVAVVIVNSEVEDFVYIGELHILPFQRN
jgi:hypothetical protein